MNARSYMGKLRQVSLATPLQKPSKTNENDSLNHNKSKNIITE